MSERLFVAIGFEDDLSQKLEKEIKKIKINLDKSELDYKWVPPKNYHVTLAFLGNLNASEKANVIEKLQALSNEILPFDLQISGVDAFSSEREARVLYCGVQNKKSLRSLVDQTREVLGLQPDEEYIPHLTIARLRNTANVKDIISPVKRKDFFKAKVTEIRLYRSVIAGPYSVYEILHRISLEKSLNVTDGDPAV